MTVHFIKSLCVFYSIWKQVSSRAWSSVWKVSAKSLKNWPASTRSSRHTANKSRLVPDKFMFDFQLEKSKPRIAIKFSINPFSAVKLENYLGLIFHVLFLFSVIASCIKIDECAKIFRQMCFIAAKLGQNRKLLINVQRGKHSGRRLVRFTALRAHSLIASSHIGLNKLA